MLFPDPTIHANRTSLPFEDPWYDFFLQPLVLPFTATLVVLALMLTVSFISSRPTR